MKKWKRKYKELKELHSQVNQLYLDQCKRTDELIKELSQYRNLNDQIFGSDYDIDKSLRDYIDIKADETRRAIHNIRYPKDDYINPMFVEYYKLINISTYFNEDKTPNQGWTIEKLYIKLTNEFPGISLKAGTLCNSNYGSLEIPCISIYNETISLHPDGKLHWDFRKDDDILEQFISYIKRKEKEADNTSISSNGQTNLEDFSKAVIKEGENISKLLTTEERLPDWVESQLKYQVNINTFINSEVVPVNDIENRMDKGDIVLHKLADITVKSL